MTSITQTEQALPVGTWNVDPVHSQVGFAVDYMVGTFRGSFSPVEATLVVAEDGSATLTGSAPVSGITVQDENLTTHLQSPEFFDIERTPQVTFTSTSIDRTRFGLNWNNPLPNGEPSLANDVTLSAELYLVKA